MLSGYREVAGAAQSYRAIGGSLLSGYREKLPIGAIGKNFLSGYREKLPIGMLQALSGKTPNREPTDSFIFL